MSIKKIAAMTGASISTVSRVLNDSSYHCRQKGLEEKIWAAARELQYLPNSAAKELRRGTASAQKKEEPLTVDIFLTRFDSLAQDAFFNELYQILKEQLLVKRILLGNVLNTLHLMDLTQGAQAKSIPYRSQKLLQAEKKENTSAFVETKKNTGLLIFGKCPENLIPVVKNRYAYIAGIDRNPTDYEYDEVTCNGTTAALKAMEHLISLGHRHIAYIGDCTSESRYIGYYQAHLNHKLPLSHDDIYPTGQTEDEGFKAMNEILNRQTKPTAVFCANDVTALGVLKALKRSRKKGYLPSVISIDNIKEAEDSTPMLTTIDIPKYEMVHLALSLLLDRRAGLHKEIVRVELPCHLMIRESCTYAPV